MKKNKIALEKFLKVVDCVKLAWVDKNDMFNTALNDKLNKFSLDFSMTDLYKEFSKSVDKHFKDSFKEGSSIVKYIMLNNEPRLSFGYYSFTGVDGEEIFEIVYDPSLKQENSNKLNFKIHKLTSDYQLSGVGQAIFVNIFEKISLQDLSHSIAKLFIKFVDLHLFQKLDKKEKPKQQAEMAKPNKIKPSGRRFRKH